MYARFAGVFAALLFAAGAFVSQGTSALAVGYCNPLGPGTEQLGQINAGSSGGANIRSAPNGPIFCLATNGTKVIMTNNTANSPVPGLSGVWRQVYYGYTLQMGWVVNEAVDPIQQHSANAPSVPQSQSSFSQFDPTICNVSVQCGDIAPPGAVSRYWVQITVNEGDAYNVACISDGDYLGHGILYRKVWGWAFIDKGGKPITMWYADGQQGPYVVKGSYEYIRCD